MSDTAPARPDPATDPAAYVSEVVWPPLPPAFGDWLADLVRRARAGEDPDLELAVPDAVLATSVPVPLCRMTPNGTVVTTLGRALTLFHAEHLLFPEPDEHDGDPVQVFEPEVALTLANTADAQAVADTYDPAVVRERSAQLLAGEWRYRDVTPIRVDRHGRLVDGLSTLLAIVQANRPAPVIAHYDTDHLGDAPLTWRGPAGWTDGAPHEH